MNGFVKIVSAAGTLMVRPEKVSAVAPIPNAVQQSQVIVDGVACVIPLTVEGFLDQLAGNPPPAPRGPKILGG